MGRAGWLFVFALGCSPAPRTALDDIVATNDPVQQVSSSRPILVAAAPQPAASVASAPDRVPTPPPRAPSSADAPPSDPSDPRCEPIDAENERRIAAFRARYPNSSPPPVTSCIADDKHVWGWSFAVESNGYGPEIFRVLVAHRASGPLGAWRVETCLGGAGDGPRDCTIAAMPLSLDNGTELRAAFDFDGDGFSEVVVERFVPTYEGGFVWNEVWTVRDHRVVLYPPTRGLKVVAVKDIDGDGRPDLVTRATSRHCVEDDEKDPQTGVVRVIDLCTGVHAPLRWHRSLTDGTFALPAPIPASASDLVRESESWARP